MSSQHNAGLHFSICHNQQNLRLLELPPSLLALLTSKDPPILSLKSAATSTSAVTATTTSHAVLCTYDQTFQIRQVQSSNSIYVVKPSQRDISLNAVDFPLPSASAIAQCKATLELIPTSPSVTLYLEQVITIYNDPQGDFEPGPDDKGSRSKLALLSDAPFSIGEFDNGWSEMCAFEIRGRAWRPSSAALLGLWKSFKSAVTVKGIDIGEVFSIDGVHQLVQEDGYPGPFLVAMLAKVAPDSENLMDGLVVTSRDKCVPWIGTVMLESQQEREGIQASRFLQQWQDQLPEAWRRHATLETLKGKYSEQKDGIIIFGGSVDATPTPGTSTPAKDTGKTARKWHEKFKYARR